MSVYFARARGYVKIGYSTDPVSRTQSILTNRRAKRPDALEPSDPIDVLGWIPGDRRVEGAMHSRFASLHVVGEWFWDTDEYDSVIEADPFGVPVADLSPKVVWLMMQYPEIPRAEIVALIRGERARLLADPDSELNQTLAFFGGTDFVQQLNEDFRAERRADRLRWRKDREAA